MIKKRIFALSLFFLFLIVIQNMGLYAVKFGGKFTGAISKFGGEIREAGHVGESFRPSDPGFHVRPTTPGGVESQEFGFRGRGEGRDLPSKRLATPIRGVETVAETQKTTAPPPGIMGRAPAIPATRQPQFERRIVRGQILPSRQIITKQERAAIRRQKRRRPRRVIQRPAFVTERFKRGVFRRRPIHRFARRDDFRRFADRRRFARRGKFAWRHDRFHRWRLRYPWIWNNVILAWNWYPNWYYDFYSAYADWPLITRAYILYGTLSNRIPDAVYVQDIAQHAELAHTLLYIAAQENNTNILRALLSNNVDPNAQPPRDYDEFNSALEVAMYYQSFDVVLLLIESGATFDRVSEDVLNEFIYAAANAGRTNILSLIESILYRK